MVSAIIDPESGELATEWCPRKTREWFKINNNGQSTAPQTPCTLHTYPEPEIIADDGAIYRGGAPDADWLDQLGKRLKRILRF